MNTFACHTHSAAQQTTAETEVGGTYLGKTTSQAVHGNILDNLGSSWKRPSQRHTTPNNTNSGTHPSTSTSPRFPPTGDHPCKWTLFSNTFRHHVRHATMQPRKKVGPLNKCAACLTLSANEKEETSQNRPCPGSMLKNTCAQLAQCS